MNISFEIFEISNIFYTGENNGSGLSEVWAWSLSCLLSSQMPLHKLFNLLEPEKGE